MTLEPCPFCGGEAEWRDDPGVCDVPFGLVVAHKDHCFLNHIAFEEADIISAWNTRAPDPRIAALEAEVARLRLDVEAQEALQVSAYHAGLKAGWNFCVSEDNAGMQAAMTNTDHIKELRSIREARAALEARNDK